jgi:hypothetical protein
MRPLALDVGDEADAAGVVFLVRRVQAVAGSGGDFFAGSGMVGGMGHGRLQGIGSTRESNAVQHRPQAKIKGVRDKLKASWEGCR